jgi:CcmD family protein
MSYFLAAYVIFWAALFGYLLALLRRQVRLIARAETLVARLGARPAGDTASTEATP